MDESQETQQQQQQQQQHREESRPDTPNSDDSDDSFHSTSCEDPTDPLCRLALGDNGGTATENGNTPCFTPEPEALEEKDKEGSEEEEKKDEEKDEEEMHEEHLKDMELNMTEEERTAMRTQSLEHKEEGNNFFRSGDMQSAVNTYTKGLRLCPLSCAHERAVLYSNRAAAKAKLNEKKEAIRDCTKAIELDDTYTKAVMRRANLHQETDQLDEALKDFQRVLELEPSNHEARAAVRRLPDMITERNEKLKEEMMGKLKDLGNMFLRPFGLSTANFELNQDQNSGGYNISFKQNPPNGH